MRIVVMSDSHGNIGNVQKIVEAQPTADLFFHLGDGEQEYREIVSRYPERRFCFVHGNSDSTSMEETSGQILLEGKSIFYTHGHMYHVKFGMEQLLYAARGRGADVVLYGHTHKPQCEYYNGLYVVNPGSCAGRELPASYALVDITKAGVVPVLVKLEGAGRSYQRYHS